MKKQFIVILLCYAVNGIFPWSAVLFRPRDDIKAYLIRMIKEERKSIDGAMYMLTDKDVAQALVDAYVRGVKVRLVLDQISMGEKYGKGLFLQQSGIEVFVHAVPNINVFLLPIMHHKFFIFGLNSSLQKSLVWTGSFNCTASAAKLHDENALMTDDASVIVEFKECFMMLMQRLNVSRCFEFEHES